MKWWNRLIKKTRKTLAELEYLESLKYYPLTPQQYLTGLNVDADNLTFRACMTTLRAMRERNIIPPMNGTTVALHEHAGAINALDMAIKYMESQRIEAVKKVMTIENKPVGVSK